MRAGELLLDQRFTVGTGENALTLIPVNPEKGWDKWASPGCPRRVILCRADDGLMTGAAVLAAEEGDDGRMFVLPVTLEVELVK